DLADGRCRAASFHISRARSVESRPGVFLARPCSGQPGSLGPLEQDLEFYAARARGAAEGGGQIPRHAGSPSLEPECTGPKAAAPRPLIFSKPPAAARKGEEFQYAVSAIRSLGDLRMRIVAGKETTSFWDIEKPRFNIQRGPAWLTIDNDTGRLSGTPDAVG